VGIVHAWMRGMVPMIVGVGLATAGFATAAHALAEDSEPSLEACTKAVAEAGEMASRLSPKSLSRYFAERFLLSAKAEAGNGEFDECLDYAAQAVEEVEHRRHWLARGETFRASTSTGYIELSGDDQ
jgi:hypothetical protein